MPSDVRFVYTSGTRLFSVFNKWNVAENAQKDEQLKNSKNTEMHLTKKCGTLFEKNTDQQGEGNRNFQKKNEKNDTKNQIAVIGLKNEVHCSPTCFYCGRVLKRNADDQSQIFH